MTKPPIRPRHGRRTAQLYCSIDRYGTSGIFKQGISQDTAEPVVTVPQAVAISRLSADGAWILFVERVRATARPIPPSVSPDAHPCERWSAPVCAGDAELNNTGVPAPRQALRHLRNEPDRKQLVITAFDPLKGRGKVLRTIEISLAQCPTSALSPDGSTFAISRVGEAEIHIRLLSLSGGSDRQITVKGWPSITGIDWSADGKGFYCGSVSRRRQHASLRRSEGKCTGPMALQGRGRFQIWGIPSPDGRYLALREP